MKHVGCRLAELGFLPFQSTIEYLNGLADHKHLKIVLQMKPYNVLVETLYKGPLISISHKIDKREITAVCGWFTVKNITFNYVYEWNVLNSQVAITSETPVEIIDYSTLQNQSFIINSKTLSNDFGNLGETLEFFPFTANRDEIKIYNYFRNKET